MFDYVDQKLTGAAKLDMEKHLRECPACAARLEGLYDQRAEEEDKPLGLFWYLLKPSGGFKRFFIAGAVLTFSLVIYLMYGHLRGWF